MTRSITDFTKLRLTQAFEAKGNSGSALIEDLQPVVSVHNLELGPFAPFVRFGWAVQIAAQAANFPMAAIGPGLGVVEETIIIDGVFLDTTQTFVDIGLSTSVAFTTTQSTNVAMPMDARLGATYQLSDNFSLGAGTTLTAPITPGLLFHGRPGTAPVPLGVVFDRKGYTISNVPQLYVIGATVNTAMLVTVHGRIFAVQS